MGAARFVKSASRLDQLPHDGMVEFALCGRSNVGKSSLLGSLLKQRSLVRTSRTPGATQLLNYFVFEERFALVDLPGYGYAKASKKKRGALSAMLQEYLVQREPLCGVFLLVDARRDDVSPLDVEVAEFLRSSGRPLCVVCTKIDLVPKNKRRSHMTRIAKALFVEPQQLIATSAKLGEGRGDLVRQMETWS